MEASGFIHSFSFIYHFYTFFIFYSFCMWKNGWSRRPHPRTGRLYSKVRIWRNFFRILRVNAYVFVCNYSIIMNLIIIQGLLISTKDNRPGAPQRLNSSASVFDKNFKRRLTGYRGYVYHRVPAGGHGGIGNDDPFEDAAGFSYWKSRWVACAYHTFNLYVIPWGRVIIFLHTILLTKMFVFPHVYPKSQTFTFPPTRT